MSTEKNVQSFKVASTLSSQRGVYISAANTVAYPAGVTNMPVGVTIDDVTETTQGIAVATNGAIAKLLFNDTVAAGALVALDTSGRGIPFVAAGTTTSSNAYVGILTSAKVDATLTVATVYIQPGLGG